MRTAVVPLVLAAALAGGMGAAQAAAPAQGRLFAPLRPVSDARLDHLRGGFTLSAGGVTIDVALGIGRIVSIDGHVVSAITVPQVISRRGASAAVSQVGGGNANSGVSVQQGTVSGAVSPSTAAVTSAVMHVIRNGPNNSGLPPAADLPAGTTATVIQNTLNSQVIQALNVMNVQVHSKALAHALSLRSTLDSMLSALRQ